MRTALTKSLTLHKETLRRLSEIELRRVAGGTDSSDSRGSSCEALCGPFPTQSDCCCG